MKELSKDKLIWERSLAREMFVDWRMWPSFMGVKVDPLKVSRGNMPVFVWEEQQVYMESSKSEQANKKRKRESSATEVEEPDNLSCPDEVNKRRKYSWLHWSGVPLSIFSAVEYAWSTITTLLVGGQSSSSDDVVSAVVDSTSRSEKNISIAKEVENGAVSQDSAVIESFLKDFVCPSGSMVVSDYSAAKNKVFSDLHSREYFLGPADVYGGDYSMYKAKDPTGEHSVGTVRVVNSSKISVKELLTFSRVQNKVAKNAVLAFSTEKTSGEEGASTSSSSIDDKSEEGEGVVGISSDVQYLLFNFKAVSERIAC